MQRIKGYFRLHRLDNFSKSAAGLALIGASGSVLAAGPDMSSLSSAIDFGTVVTAVLAAAAALIVVYIAWKGAKLVIGAVKGG